MKILIFEEGGFTTKVLTRLLVERGHEVTALKGLQAPATAWIGLDQELQPVAFEPSHYDLAFIDQNLAGAPFTEVVKGLSQYVPCIGLSTFKEIDEVFKQHGAKLALVKSAIFAGLVSDRIDCSHMRELDNTEEAALSNLETEMAHPSSECMLALRKQTDAFLIDVLQG